jgi:predicted porin
MKKTLVVAAVSASFAVAAHAQSSVTLYGVIDAGLTYTSNVRGSSNWEQNSGAVDQSRFGLRGSEDLGNGLKAIFNLESGFNLSNGRYANSGSEFNRQSYVGLSSNYGTVTLGKQYDAAQDFLAPLSATGSWGGTQFAHYGNFDNLSTTGATAVNNSVKFTSANYAGFTFGATYGFSNQAGGFASNREYSFGAAYQFQGLRVAAAYAQQNNPLASTTGASDGSNFGVGANAVATLANGGVAATIGNFRQRTYGVGASYAFGPAQVGAVWTQARLDNAALASVREDNYEVNAKYNLTPALGLGVAYTYSNGTVGNRDAHWNQVGLQADYALSKRTDVYAQAVYQRASGANASIYNGDVTGATSTSSGINQTAATVGLRHRF